MSKVDVLTERYNNLKKEYESLEEEVRRDEAKLSVKREELDRMKEELPEEGIEFNSLKELREIKTETEERIEVQVSKMEEVLGIEEEIYEEYEEDEDFELDL